MMRSSNTEKSLRLNAAFDLLAQGYTVADAAEALTQEFGCHADRLIDIFRKRRQ
jgi:hypothetical protein